MRFGFSEACLEHDPGDHHPERPARIKAIQRGLAKRHGVEYVEADPVSAADIEAVHDPAYVEDVRSFCRSGGGNWDPDTVATEATWGAARASAGLATWAGQAALSGVAGRDTPFALGRPPGHHATADDAMGFCFLNNAAIAAAAARDRGGAERVAVVDWDVHHGNGTQDIFYDAADVLYVSVHEDGLYPGTGDKDEVGEGDGAGTTLNVPVPAGSGDAEYLAVFDDLIVPLVARFDPGLVLVSAGFDGHRHDPISRIHLTTEGYGALTERVRTLSETVGAPLAFVLEGGYGLETLARSVGMVHEVFDGREPVETEDDPNGAVAGLIDDLRENHPGLI